MKQEEPTTSKQLLAGLLAFLWLGLLAGGYFWAHKPFEMEVITAVAQTTLNILTWLALTWLAGCAGLLLLGRLRLTEEDAAARLVLALGIGLGLLAVAFSLFGFVGLFRPLTAWLFVLALGGVTFRRWRQPLLLLRQVGWPRPQNRLHWLILVYGAASLLFTFIMALTPVVAWDSLTYHLVGPKLYIEAGRFVHPLNIPQLGFPLLGQMHFTLGMLLVGDGVAPLFHFGYGLLALLLLVSLSRQLFGAEAAWLSAAVLLSSPLLLTLMGWPYVDVTLLFYTTAVFYAFIGWWQTRRTGWLIVIGLMLGFSGGLKYTAVAAPIAVTLGIFWGSRKEGFQVFAGRLLPVGGIAILLVLPWLAENYLTTGNPIYPFFRAQSLFWDEWRAWWYNRPGTGLWATAPLSLLLAPLEATILDGTLAQDSYDGTIGPFILGLLFLLPLTWGKFSQPTRRWATWLLLWAGVAFAFWLWGIARSALLLQVRLLLPAFALFALLGGLALAGTQRWKLPQLAVDWLVRVLISLTLLLLLVSQTLAFWGLNPLPVVVGLESEARYLRRMLGVYDEAITAVNQLPPDAHVQFLWEARSYRCQVFCQPDPILDTWLHLTQFHEYNAAAVARVWQEAGVTHVLLYDAGLRFIVEAGFDPVTETDMATWAAFNGRYLRPIQQWSDQYTLYEFVP
ncbi:MAG: glycosyltransferase family 39 protein [Chloroflexi bacterium]|nr:glycosyltransferase family 39 protein [Chloroflexota bacterium]